MLKDAKRDLENYEGNLSLTTGSLNFTDLRDIHQSSQTSGSISTSVSIGGGGGNDLAKDGKGREMTVNTTNLTYSNTSEYSAGNSLATLGTGTITVGGTVLEENGELTEAGQNGDSPLAGLNRDTTDTTYELWDVERTEGNIDLQVDHRFFSEEGRQSIKNDFVDTGEFGQDIARSVNAVTDSENLGFLDFWETLDNTAKGTQIKNALVRDPANADILAGLASENGDEYAQAMQQLANLAQDKFGVELTDLNFYDGEGTLNTSLMDTVLTDVKGGTIMEGEGAGDMFIDGTDGADKYDMNNTLGHEVIESVTALTGGTNDAAQEDQATAFGSHFADRVDQAFEGGINATSTGAFTTSLANSNAVQTGTNAANAASGASFDNRRLTFSESQVLQNGRERIANNPNLTEEQKQQDITRLNALACAEVRCARGVSSDDPLYEDLKKLEDLGNQLGEAGYSLDGMLGEEAVAGQFSTGLGDWFDDQLTSSGELLTRAGGVVQAAGGSAGAVGGGALATAGGVGCGPTAGTSCLLVPAGGALMYIGVDEAQEGWQTAVGPFTHTEGQAVFDTLYPETHPGNNNPTLEAAGDAGMFILEIAAGKVGGKYLDDVLDASPSMTPVPLRVADDVPPGGTKDISDDTFVRFDPVEVDSSIDELGVQTRFFEDGKVWITKYGDIKDITDPTQLETVLYRRNLWNDTQGKFQGGATLRAIDNADDAIPSGVTNMTDGVRQWQLRRDVPAEDLETILRLPKEDGK